MNETEIQEFWLCFKEYLDKKHVDTAAERYIDLLADMGVQDQTFVEALGADSMLDSAIRYYLDDDAEEVYDNEDGYDWDD